VKDLTLRDLLFVIAFPYIAAGYLLLHLAYAPIELLGSLLKVKKKV